MANEWKRQPSMMGEDGAVVEGVGVGDSGAEAEGQADNHRENHGPVNYPE
jgi:hypothetical protein